MKSKKVLAISIVLMASLFVTLWLCLRTPSAVILRQACPVKQCLVYQGGQYRCIPCAETPKEK
jgi:hypothetical protein